MTVRKYYVGHRGRRFGPLPLADLTSRRLTDEMLVWCEGMPDWRPILEIEELRGFVAGSAGPAARSVGRPPERSVPPAAAVRDAAPPLAPPPLPPPAVAAGAGQGRSRFVAIVTIVLACLGLAGCPLAIAADLGLPLPYDLTSGVDPWVIAIARGGLHAGLLLVSVAMLIGGLGLLQHRWWAACVMAVASVLCILAGLATVGLEYAAVQGPLFDALHEDIEDGGRLGVFVAMTLINTVSGLASLVWHGTSLAILGSAAVRSTLQ